MSNHHSAIPVIKGSDGIRVVWGPTKNGVNGLMFTPRFFLATAGTYLRRLEVGMFGGDFDIAEKVPQLPPAFSNAGYCGVELPANLVEALQKEEARPSVAWLCRTCLIFER